MNSLRIKKGDKVVVISGREKGKEGKVLSTDPKAGTVIIEGVNFIQRHTKPRKQGEEGGIIKREAALNASKVMRVCPKCGKQVEELKSAQPNVVINNTNTNANVNTIRGYGRPKNKWVSFFLCLFFGMIGAHKFYEGKVGTGILYLFTLGLCGIGWVIDTIAILLKPNPYYV